ncbi:MAG: Na(+)/H(+) antiporter subunit D [Parvibaculum sp.]|uniref:Na(+)/H(+) antiporter subunit D n=1 Tax=Parvibaculum sp. TaxID=2024848 RepID=UPI003C795E68
MSEIVTPALIYVAGALLTPLIRHHALRGLFLLAVPLVALASFIALPFANYGTLPFLDLRLGFLRIDALSYAFALIFSLAAFLALLYAWHVRDKVEQVSTLLYAGAAIGAVFAADLVTLFIFWEGTALASVFLIWSRRTEGAYHTGLRYLAIQIGSGLLLLVGIILHYQQTGSIAFERMELGSTATWLIFLAFGIKCAFPLLNNWLQDAYPAATLTGTVTLSAFTTKLAVYALARGFAGTEYLIYIGAAMAVLPVFYATIENNLRRTLAYSLNSQLGFMVVGIGIGTPLALSGAVAHAAASTIYQALLFMSVGAVLYRTGSDKASELGGLARSMPLTFLFCIVGAFSIASVPLFSGFVTKSLVVSAAGSGGYFAVWIALTFASVGVLAHTGIRIPYVMFLGADRGLKVAEAPRHMLVAMGLASALCLAIGVWPQLLYAYLPHPVEYRAFSLGHVVTQLQLLAFAGLAFALLMRRGVQPTSLRSINLDTDWLYRRFLPGLVGILAYHVRDAWRGLARFSYYRLERMLVAVYSTHGPQGLLARTWPTGSMVLWIAVLLGITLSLAYL